MVAYDLPRTGYNMHVFDDGHDWFQSDDADEWGRGPAHDMLVNAINNHGQSEVALFGYSHGGGTVYNMSWRLHHNYADTYGRTITQPFTLSFTSYIDAVPNGHYLDGVLGDSLEVVPAGSDFHTNQFQTNSWVSGCYIVGADDNVNRSSLGVEHSGGGELGIDTNTIVQEFLTVRFHQKVSR